MSNFKTFDERERAAYIEGDTEKAELLTNSVDLEQVEEEHMKEVADLEEKISDLVTENHDLSMKLSKAEDGLNELIGEIKALIRSMQ